MFSTALSTILVSGLVAGVYSFFGYRLFRRPVSEESRLASAQFAVFWAGIGVTIMIQGAEVALAAFNDLPFALALSLRLMTALVTCAFLWGLVGFLTYVYTGRYHLLELSVFYGSFFFIIMYWILAQEPFSVVISAGVPRLLGHGLPSAWLSGAVTIGDVVPVVVGAALYLSLYGRTVDPAQRLRICMVGASILLWLALEEWFPGTTTELLLTKHLLQLIPGLMSFVAFFPPAWVRRLLQSSTPLGGDDVDPVGRIVRS
jgi:hypothetical protein